MSDLISRLKQLDEQFPQTSLRETLRQVDARHAPLIDPQAAAQHLEKGDALAGSDKIPDLEDAIRFYEAAARLDPNNREAAGKLGLARVHLAEEQSKIAYREGVELYKKGNLEQAVGKFKAATMLGVQEVPEIREWFRDGPIQARDWNDIQAFAGTLEQLVKLNAGFCQTVSMNDRNQILLCEYEYKREEEKLKDIQFDVSHLHPFLHEAVLRRDYKTLGIFVSAMINKIIKSDETIILDLSRYNTAPDREWRYQWRIDFLAYRHGRGKLIIKGGSIEGLLTASLCERMSGGEVNIYSDFSYTLVLGKDMGGGTINSYANPSGSTTGYHLRVGPNMTKGEINIHTSVNEDDYLNIKMDLGSYQKGGVINVFIDNKDRPWLRAKATHIGRNQTGGKINFHGDVYATTIGKNSGGSIIIDGSVITYSLGRDLNFGEIYVKKNVQTGITDLCTLPGNTSRDIEDDNGYVGEGNRGGCIIIDGNASIIAPPPIRGGVIRVNGEYVEIKIGDLLSGRAKGEVWLKDIKIEPVGSFLKLWFGTYCNVSRDRTYIYTKK